MFFSRCYWTWYNRVCCFLLFICRSLVCCSLFFFLSHLKLYRDPTLAVCAFCIMLYVRKSVHNPILMRCLTDRDDCISCAEIYTLDLRLRIWNTEYGYIKDKTTHFNKHTSTNNNTCVGFAFVTNIEFQKFHGSHGNRRRFFYSLSRNFLTISTVLKFASSWVKIRSISYRWNDLGSINTSRAS